MQQHVSRLKAQVCQDMDAHLFLCKLNSKQSMVGDTFLQ
jgi:hypothetical protein